jgi:hypothetical protein
VKQKLHDRAANSMQYSLCNTAEQGSVSIRNSRGEAAWKILELIEAEWRE